MAFARNIVVMPSPLHVFTAILLALPVFAAILWGTELETFTLSRGITFFIPFSIYLFLLAKNRFPLRFCISTLIVLFPILGISVPPVRWQISVFDVIAALTLAVYAMQWMRNASVVDLLPSRSAALILAAALLPALFALDRTIAALEWLRFVEMYFIFVCLVHFAKDENWRYFMIKWLAIGLAVSALAVIAQKATGLDLSLYRARQDTLLDGVTIKRGSGFFQDPQKAAQFIATLVAVIAVLWSQGIITARKTRLLALSALAVGLVALVFTVSRMALAGGLVAAATALIFLYKGRPERRLAVVVVSIATVALVAGIFLVSPDTARHLAPTELVKRFEATSESAKVRWQIWNDSWRIFEQHPLLGVGPGNYRSYWVANDPRLASMEAHHIAAIPDQPESGFLKILYEGGIVVTAALILLFVVLAKKIAAMFWMAADPFRKAVAWSSLLGFCVFGLTFFTLFTTSDARNALLFIVLCALVVASAPRTSATIPQRMLAS